MAVLVSAAQDPGYGQEVFAPQPYSYQYGVADEYSKANFQKTESQDGNVHYDNNKYENELFVFRAMSKDLL